MLQCRDTASATAPANRQHGNVRYVKLEETLLVRRELLRTVAARSLTFTANAHLDAHVDYLSDQIMRILRQEGFATNCGEGN